MQTEVRRQAIDISTSRRLTPGDPAEATFNLADSGVLSPTYPTETGMSIAISTVCFPNCITNVQNYNRLFFVKDGHGNVYPVPLPIGNFKGLKGLASTVAAALNQYTLLSWTVTPNEPTNTLTFALPSTITTTYQVLFTDQYVNGTLQQCYASACKLLGFRQSDAMILTPTVPTINSTVPCQASGANMVYIACDLFSLESASVDLFDNTRRGSLLGKLQICDAPWTTATYQDQLTTFELKMPAFSVAQFTVFLLNEELQKVEMPVDWNFSAVVRYFGPSPIADIAQRLVAMEELLRYINLKQDYQRDDYKKQLKVQNELRNALEQYQGRRTE